MNINLYSINNIHTKNIMNLLLNKFDNHDVNNLKQKQKQKQVSFATIVFVVLIPTIDEYKSANLFHDIWGSLYPSNLVLRDSHFDTELESK